MKFFPTLHNTTLFLYHVQTSKTKNARFSTSEPVCNRVVPDSLVHLTAGEFLLMFVLQIAHSTHSSRLFRCYSPSFSFSPIKRRWVSFHHSMRSVLATLVFPLLTSSHSVRRAFQGGSSFVLVFSRVLWCWENPACSWKISRFCENLAAKVLELCTILE